MFLDLMRGQSLARLRFSFVLVENSRSLQENDYCFLHDVFAKLRFGACCVVLDSSQKLHEPWNDWTGPFSNIMLHS